MTATRTPTPPATGASTFAATSLPGWKGGGVWSPANLSGLLLWLDADNVNGTADGAGVDNWPDQSGNGNDFPQAVSANQPIYRADAGGTGNPGIELDPGASPPAWLGNEVIAIGGNTGTLIAVVTVGSILTGIDYYAMGRQYQTDGLFVRKASASAYRMSFRGNGLEARHVRSPDITGETITMVGVRDGITNNVWANGEAGSETPPASVAVWGEEDQEWQAGTHGNNLKQILGYVHVCILLSETISTEERLLLEAYMSAKYGSPDWS